MGQVCWRPRVIWWARGWGFGLVFEAAQHACGISGVGADPAFVDGVDGQGVEVVPALAATTFGDDEAGVFQHFEMLHDGAAIKLGQQFTKGAGGARLCAQQIQNVAANAVAEGLEDGVVMVFD